jgi:hypothetical protein
MPEKSPCGLVKRPPFTDAPIRPYIPFIFFNEHWNRAWVAQEVLLAKDPVLLIAGQLAPRDLFCTIGAELGIRSSAAYEGL